MRTFAHYCNGLFGCLWYSRIQGRVVASSLVSLRHIEIREHLSDKVSGICFVGKGEAKAFEDVCDGQKHVLWATHVHELEKMHKLTNLPH